MPSLAWRGRVLRPFQLVGQRAAQPLAHAQSQLTFIRLKAGAGLEGQSRPGPVPSAVPGQGLPAFSPSAAQLCAYGRSHRHLVKCSYPVSLCVHPCKIQE